ncbi:Guanylnucleotide exchange factorlike, partial [Caligus rogercresseyi]
LQEEVMLPGESQKIEKIIEVFSKRYIQCNSLFVSSFFLTRGHNLCPDLRHGPPQHGPPLQGSGKILFSANEEGGLYPKPPRLDGGRDLDEDMLRGIFDRIRGEPFLPGPDHSSQVLKGLAKKKTLHQYRYSVSLRDLRVHTFSSGFCPHGIQIQDRFSGKVISTFDAKSESDQARFVHDLQESISETIEMDRARLYFDDVEDEEML